MKLKRFFEIVRELMECPVCLETIKEEFKSPCGHSMCSSCFDKWRDEQVQKCCSVTCPTCRFVIVEVKSIQVDLFAYPRGYVDIEERHIGAYSLDSDVPFPSMPEEEYNEMMEEHHDDDDDEDDEEDWDSKDDWEYEDVENYVVSIVYSN